MAATGIERRDRLARARLYLCLDARPHGGDPGPLLAAALRGGVDVVQLRDKEAGDAEILAAATVFRRLCDEHGTLFVLNDRPDLAVRAAADGVHVGQEDMPVAAARAIVGPDVLVGLSTHAPAELDAAEGTDYIAVGPVWATPTKEGRPAAGLDYVHYAAARARVPWFAIGGIDLERAPVVVAAGATRVCVLRAIRDAGDPEAVARALRALLAK
ncbi:MAG: thiamine phosphate synthase [Actinobacteria bacterium]|nr:thiamine phosphate synthase [Actinomycetota bacterium]